MREHSLDHGRDSTIMGTAAPRLRMLSRLRDYEVADGDPDIRGWKLFDATGESVGTIHDLIIDMEQKEARYLDVQLEAAATTGGQERHVLVPIGLARLSDDVEAVTLTTLDRTHLAALPSFDHSVITRDKECELQGSLRGDPRPTPDTGAAFYESPEFTTVVFWGARHGHDGRGYAVIARETREH